MITSLRRLGGRVTWYVGSVMGDRDYRRYLELHARHGDPMPPMTESEYWRRRWEHADNHPQGRCC